jgi:long-subunit fatty acid transport protein
MFFLWICWTTLATAAGLDQVEVGGLWGHPLSTDATALHWNPAGLAAKSGSAFMFEGAPQIAAVEIERDHPLFGGHSSYRTFAVAPFAAVKTKLGSLGLGLGLAVPYGKSSASIDGEFGVSSYSLVRGGSFTLAIQTGAAYDFGRVQVGGSLSTMVTTFSSQVNNSLVPDLVAGFGQKHFTEEYIEDSHYATTSRADGLSGVGFSGSLGIRVALNDTLTLGASYLHGSRVKVSGEARQTFACGRPDDEVGQAVLTFTGLCDADLKTHFTNEWRLPWRVQMAIQWQPKDEVELTAMGAFVRWSVFDNYRITIADVDTLNDIPDPTAKGLNSVRLNARDNQDTFWVALDGKVKVRERLLLGARITYDHPAVPIEVLSPNNFDGPTVAVGVLAAYSVLDRVQIGVSTTHQFIATRTVTDGAFGLTLERPEDTRLFWANNNGTYAGRITRLGLSLRGVFGGER